MAELRLLPTKNPIHVSHITMLKYSQLLFPVRASTNTFRLGIMWLVIVNVLFCFPNIALDTINSCYFRTPRVPLTFSNCQNICLLPSNYFKLFKNKKFIPSKRVGGTTWFISNIWNKKE